MIYYTPSALDSNETLLQALHRVEKYLKDNPIYKVYAVNASYVVGTSQYDLSDIVASESSLAEGDVVFFDNNYYAYVFAVGSEVFSVSNASSFKGATGSQGIQGPQGPAGADGQDGQDGRNGTDGKPTLFSYNTPTTSQLPAQGITISYNTTTFNRTPETNEKFLGTFMYSGDLYMGMFSVATVASPNTSCSLISYAKMTGPQGEAGQNGTNGKVALIIDRTINFTNSGSASQLLPVSLPFSYFNREPSLNEDFVGVLYDSSTQKTYLAQCEVQAIENDYVTEVVATDIADVTGPAGQDGADGTDGVSALVLTDIVPTAILPQITASIGGIAVQYFSREPIIGDHVTGYFRYTTTNELYAVAFVIEDYAAGSATIYVNGVQKVNAEVLASDINSQTAPNGYVLMATGSGTTVWDSLPTPSETRYTATLTLSNTTDLRHLARIMLNAKKVMLNPTIYAGAFIGPLNCIVTGTADNVGLIKFSSIGVNYEAGADQMVLCSYSVNLQSAAVITNKRVTINTADNSITTGLMTQLEITAIYWAENQID